MDIHRSKAATRPKADTRRLANPTRAATPNKAATPTKAATPNRAATQQQRGYPDQGGYPDQRGYPDQARLPRPGRLPRPARGYPDQGGYPDQRGYQDQSAATPTRGRGLSGPGARWLRRRPMSSVLRLPAATAARATTRATARAAATALPAAVSPAVGQQGYGGYGDYGRGPARQDEGGLRPPAPAAPPNNAAGLPRTGRRLRPGLPARRPGIRPAGLRTSGDYTQYAESVPRGGYGPPRRRVRRARRPRLRLRASPSWPVGQPADYGQQAGGGYGGYGQGGYGAAGSCGHPAARRRQRPDLPAARRLQHRGSRPGRPVPVA